MNNDKSYNTYYVEPLLFTINKQLNKTPLACTVVIDKVFKFFLH